MYRGILGSGQVTSTAAGSSTAAADHPADPIAATGHLAACPVVTAAGVHPDDATTAAAVHTNVATVPVPAATAIITQHNTDHTSTTVTSSVASQCSGASVP